MRRKYANRERAVNMHKAYLYVTCKCWEPCKSLEVHTRLYCIGVVYVYKRENIN